MDDSRKALIDRVQGAYYGAALGDALGGPIEGWHWERIRATHGRVETLLPYDQARLKPGYAIHGEPGSITDDTYIRHDVATYVLRTPPEQRTVEGLAEFLMAEADFDKWWQPPTYALWRIELGEATPANAGLAHPPGGGIGWWTPVGIVWAGQPERAAAEVRRLSAIWKAPLEQHLAGAVQAGTAVAIVPGSTMDDVIAAVRAEAGPLGRKLLDRAIEVARRRLGDWDGFVDEVYDRLLVREVTTEVDGPMPQNPGRPDPATYRAMSLFAEHVPVALAALVHGQGDFFRTMTGVIALGLDTDSISTTTGTWIGALTGIAAIRQDWRETLIGANPDVDIAGDAGALAEVAARNYREPAVVR